MFLSLIITSGVIVFLFNGLPRLLAPTLLEQIKLGGELIVYTRNSPTTYYEGPDGPSGLEYDMAKMFADELGVKLTMVIPEQLNDILDGIEDGRAHLAAAGLTITEDRKKIFLFGPPYQEITEQLIYNINSTKPKNLSSIGKDTLEIVAGSSHEERLRNLKKDIPDLSWKSNDDMDSEELLQLVSDGIVDYTIADSNEFALSKPLLLNLRAAFDISEPQQLAWLFSRHADHSLYDEAVKFFEKIRKNGELTRLIERAYGHVDNLDYVGTITFRRHIAQRLPAYERMFRKAGKDYGLDWLLLVAIGYQESHLRFNAVSPTGVRGIMMLTQKTAGDLGVDDRLDPESSIDGGARYFVETHNRIPEDITEPDRTWMAMAAYNVGFGHLEDARVLTEERGLDPDKWVDVKTSLPLLAKRKWYKKTRYGYARGWEPVRYVENIRSYYDILRRDAGSDATGKDLDVLKILPSVL